MKFGPIRPGAIIKGTFRSIVDVPAWLGFKWLKSSTHNLIQQAKLIYADQFYRPTIKETYAEAMVRLKLTEADMQARAQALKRDSYIFGVGSVLCLLYMFYLFWDLHFIAAILAYLAGMVFLSMLARSRFWLFQIKHKKLGCTISEWLSGQVEDETHE